MTALVNNAGPGSPTYSWVSAGLFDDDGILDATFLDVDNISENTEETIVTLTVTRSDNGCDASRSATVFVNNNPVVEIDVDEDSGVSNADQAICLGDIAILSALESEGNAPYTFLWNTLETDESIIVPEVVGQASFSVVVTDVNGCEAEDAIAINTFSLPEIQVSSIEDSGNTVDDDEICEGDEVTLTSFISGVSPFEYNWNDGSTSSQLTDRPTSDMLYELTVTDSRDCDNSGGIQIIVQDLPQLALSIAENSGNSSGDNTICSDDPFTLIAVNNGAGQNPTTYNWNGDSNTNGEWAATFAAQDETEIEPLIVFAENVYGCLSTLDINLVVEPLPDFLIDVQVDLSNNVGGQLLCTPTDPDWEYMWTLSDPDQVDETSGENTVTLTNTKVARGLLEITLDVLDTETGCDDQEIVPLNFPNPGECNAFFQIVGTMPFCLNESIAITDNSTLGVA